LPASFQMVLPVGFLAERDHQHSDCQPVPIAGGRLETVRDVLEIPAQVLDLPLVGADLPASVNGDGDGLSAFDLTPQCGSPWSWQPAIQERFGGPGSLSFVSRAQLAPSTSGPSLNNPAYAEF
jgi:hypothetical protein